MPSDPAHSLPKHVLPCITELLDEEKRRIHYSFSTKWGGEEPIPGPPLRCYLFIPNTLRYIKDI